MAVPGGIMRVLLIAPDTSGPEGVPPSGASPARQSVVPEIRALTTMHRVTVLNGAVTAADVYAACRGETRDILHFATPSDEEHVQLSGDEMLDAEDIAQVARLAHTRLVFFNGSRSAKLAAFAVGHGVAYAIAATVNLPARDAWKTALSFYEYLREQMLKLNDPSLVDIPTAFRQAVNGDGTYMLLSSVQRHAEIGELLSEVRHLAEQLKALQVGMQDELRRVWLYGGLALAAGISAWGSVLYFVLRTASAGGV